MRYKSLLAGFLLLLIVLLNGCGFHLRGAAAEQLSHSLPEVYLSGVDARAGFGRELSRVLRANGVKVHRRESVEMTELKIKPIKATRQVLSVDREIRAREYVLISTVSYLLNQPSAIEKKKFRTISVRREQVIDPNRILGGNQEERRLRKEMEQELAQLLVLRLRF